MTAEIAEKFRGKVLSNTTFEKEEWQYFQNFLYTNGMGLEETLKFLYFNQPSQEAFLDWFFENRNEFNHSDIENEVLTKEDLAFWEENGYLVLKNAISKEDCDNTNAAILDFLDVKIGDNKTWYKNHEAKEGLMVLFTKHPTLEKNRNSAKIKKAYEQLYGSNKIYKTIDKVSFNPPENEKYKFLGSSLHWDVSLQLPIPFSLQGLLYLTDVQENSGAFHCVPGFHHEIENWLKKLPPNTNPREQALMELSPKPVLGNAGDFIIWHQALPHCATPNYSHKPRIVQYLTYLPIDADLVADVWI